MMNNQRDMNACSIACTILKYSIRACYSSDKLSGAKRICVHFFRSWSDANSCSNIKMKISHTGTGVPKEQAKDYLISLLNESLKIQNTFLPISGNQLYAMTTEFKDTEIRCYLLNYDQENEYCIGQLPSVNKPSKSFSGTEFTFEASGCIENLVWVVVDQIRKVSVLQMKILYEIKLENFSRSALDLFKCHLAPGESHSSNGNVFTLSFSAGLSRTESFSIDLLKLGATYQAEIKLAELNEHLKPNFQEWNSNKYLMVGSSQEENSSETSWIVQSCVVICLLEQNPKNKNIGQVFTYLNHFASVADEHIIDVLQNKVNWDHFGFILDKVDVPQNDKCLLNWKDENALGEVTVYIHAFDRDDRWSEFPTSRIHVLKRLLKNSIENALGDLKRQNPMLFSSAFQSKILEFIPDFTKCIVRMIQGSGDSQFQQECSQIIGLDDGAAFDFGTFEKRIEEKLHSVITHQLEKKEEGKRNYKKERKRKSVVESKSAFEE